MPDPGDESGDLIIDIPHDFMEGMNVRPSDLLNMEIVDGVLVLCAVRDTPPKAEANPSTKRMMFGTRFFLGGGTRRRVFTKVQMTTPHDHCRSLISPAHRLSPQPSRGLGLLSLNPSLHLVFLNPIDEKSFDICQPCA